MRLLNYFPTAAVLAVILYLSLADVHSPGTFSFPYMDKVAHFCMYGGLVSVMYFDLSRVYMQLPKRGKLFAITWLCPVLFGGLVELFQKYMTVGRSAEWLDFLANMLGATCGMLAGIYIIFPLVKKIRKHVK